MLQFLVKMSAANRRAFPRHLLHGITTLAMWAAVSIAAQCIDTQRANADQPPPPNFVFIMADDLGWADVAFHGGNTPTPNLDRLAREGLELTEHYVAPVCSPTRSALLTGRCWSRFNVTTPSNALCLPWETVTVARALKQVGYDTCLTGKWHLGSLPEQGPNKFGFDHSYGSLAGGVTPWLHFYKKGPWVRTWHRNCELIEDEGHVTPLITQEAINWLKGRSADTPFFLYVPYTAVHLPVKEPEEWVARAPSEITGEVARHYSASIMNLDDSVGRIIETLEALDLRKNTLIVFTSDNGGSTAENNDLKYPDDDCPTGPLPGNNKPLRGQKGSLYEGGTRVPTVVYWPERIQPGKADSPTQITDWMPTFCALAGYQAEQDLRWDGTDLSPVLFQGEALPERSLYAVGPNWRAQSLRRGDWKLIVHKGRNEDQQDKVELFNIKEDLSEKQDLSAEQPEKVQQMLQHLKAAAANDRDAVAQ